MGQICSCSESHSDTHLTFEISNQKLKAQLFKDQSTADQQPLDLKSIVMDDSLQLSFCNDDSIEITSSLLQLDLPEDDINSIVLSAFYKYVEHIMKLVKGRREYRKRKTSRTAKYMETLPRIIVGPNTDEIEEISPLYMKEDIVYLGKLDGLGFRTGFGYSYNGDGSVFEGSWSNDMYSGFGRLVQEEGKYYEGEFANGQFEGNGFCKTLNITYYGQWLRGLAHGTGHEVSNGVYTYDGEYYEGFKTGTGRMSFVDDGSYVGEFKLNLFDGFGVRIWKDKTYCGHWSKGQMHGTGTLTSNSVMKYQGSFANNARDGFGIIYFKDGREFSGHWVNDTPVGIGELKQLDGSKQQITYPLENFQ